MASLHDEVLETIKRIEKNPRRSHTPGEALQIEEALQIAQIKALLLIAQVLEERLDAPPKLADSPEPGRVKCPAPVLASA